MDTSILLIVVVLALPLLVLLVAGLVMLIASRQTRALGIGLVGVLAVTMLMGAAMFVLLNLKPYKVSQREAFTLELEKAASAGEARVSPQVEPAAPNSIPVSAEVTSEDEMGDLATSEEPVSMEVALDADSSSPPPTARPSWVESPPVRDGELHTVAIASGPYATLAECQEALQTATSKVTTDYIQWYLSQAGTAPGVRFQASPREAELLTRRATHQEVVQASFGPMHQLHALLEFDPAFREHLDRRVTETVVSRRLLHTGLFSVVVLALVATLFGYLKVDTATAGRHTGLLQLTTGTVILALVAGGLLAVRWIT